MHVCGARRPWLLHADALDPGGCFTCWRTRACSTLTISIRSRGLSPTDSTRWQRFQRLSGAADGRIYLSSEDGDIFVVRAGPTFEILGRYPMGEPLMATPALAGNTMYVRGDGIVCDWEVAGAAFRRPREGGGEGGGEGGARRGHWPPGPVREDLSDRGLRGESGSSGRAGSSFRPALAGRPRPTW